MESVKDLVIGAFNNYTNFNVLKPWVRSIKQTGFDGDIVLIAIDTSDEMVERLEAEGITVLRYTKTNDMRIHMLRFIYIYNYLRDNHKKYRYVISTDVRDVIFQLNPSFFLEKNLLASDFYSMVASSESILIKDEKWNRENIFKNFGQYFYDEVKDREVCNVGILAGRPRSVMDMCFYLYQMSLGRPDWVADQAVYNILLNKFPWNQKVLITNLSYAWALNAHVTNKPEQLNEFGPFLLEKRPFMDTDGLVKNSNNQTFSIVHQYDRVPEWTQVINKKYGVNDLEENTPKYFVYKPI